MPRFLRMVGPSWWLHGAVPWRDTSVGTPSFDLERTNPLTRIEVIGQAKCWHRGGRAVRHFYESPLRGRRTRAIRTWDWSGDTQKLTASGGQKRQALQGVGPLSERTGLDELPAPCGSHLQLGP